jgi:hypothetical protein
VEEKTSMLRCCGHAGYVDPQHRARLRPLLHSVQNQLVESASFLGSRPFQDGGRSVWVPDLSGKSLVSFVCKCVCVFNYVVTALVEHSRRVGRNKTNDQANSIPNTSP